ncbi:MAG: hypothetical protein ABI488_25780 [Polyangiaceae bacterium]
MRESYGLSGRPELLYNLARLEREQHHCLAALEAYRQYLERVPQGKYREPAQGALNELAQECPSSPPEEAPTPPNPVAANGAKPAPVSPPPRTQPAYWSRTRVLGWAAVSAGALSGGAALYFAQAARRARDDVQHNVELVKKGRALWNQARQDDQNRDDALAQVLGVSAGGLIAGGLVALLVSAPPTAPPSVAVWVEPGGLEASYSGSF